MGKNSQDELARIYATLSALRKNIDKMPYVEEIYVHEFHNVLDRLKDIGIDVDEFYIPDFEIQPHLTSINTLSGTRTYTDEKYVKKAYILTKLDAVIGYFEIIMSPEQKKIGFRKSEG